MSHVPSVRLNNGVWMPVIGFGVYDTGSLEECEACVSQALEAGYRLIDTAAMYGNEEAVGRAIRSSGLRREEVFVTTKVWFTDSGFGRTREAFFRSLDRLGLDYVDLYLIHQPYGDVYGSWRAMEELYQEGLIRAMGVSNFHGDRLMDLAVHGRTTPAVNQLELHPLYQREDDLAVLARYGVMPQAWGPLARGRGGMLTNRVLTLIAAKHRRTVAQVVLRWLVQRGIPVIPKTVKRERMVENLAVFDFNLDEADLEAIRGLDTGMSYFGDHRDPSHLDKLVASGPSR
ncbi:aldo/keto reductase [Thermanaerovibrio acidaminovorans DSM 6589]|uniref:Aldo/keto reductase n=1 Tax=Thermanaerovibrio acidaminovorans (strain ATCC 49978 / DSM 6589 / Su883) TaxID=525903 RepID=D1B764_THEAS|nr:aldo/keto reductase [Thermanaerovibrio acidaminovorans]ACZ19855.1 aldo/keto reductase [Thermanaerovibrio acidaminovorans DSM 6589]